MKILATSDIHIGRIPSVPDNGLTLTGRDAWNAVVAKAIAQGVYAVVLAGDVVEHDNAWFEAYGALTSGLNDLKKKGIRVFGVAGNHDADVFPRLADDCKDSIRLLGLGGKWEAVDCDGVKIVGWSFPGRHYRLNPLDGFPHDLFPAGEPALGLLHCDLDSAGLLGSSYAPVNALAVQRSPVPLWVLGHVHAGGRRADGRALYCGSPYALDSSETGRHGVWLLECDAGGGWKTPQFLPLSPWRFEDLPVDLDAAGCEDDVTRPMTTAMRALGRGLVEEQFQGTVHCRLMLRGTIKDSFRPNSVLTAERLADFVMHLEGVTLRLRGEIRDDTQVAVDLEQLSQGTGPMALLARQLLNPETESVRDLLARVRQLDEESWRSPTFGPLERPESALMDEQECRYLLQRAGQRLLQAMYSARKGEAQ